MDRLFNSPLLKSPLFTSPVLDSPVAESPLPDAASNLSQVRQLNAVSKISTASETNHGAQGDGAGPQLHENERMSQIVAYSSQYLFWVTIVCLSGAIVLLQL